MMKKRLILWLLVFLSWEAEAQTPLSAIAELNYRTVAEADSLPPDQVEALLVIGDEALPADMSKFAALKSVRFSQPGSRALNADLQKLTSLPALMDIQLIGTTANAFPDALKGFGQLRSLVIAGPEALKVPASLDAMKSLERLHFGHPFAGGCGLKSVPKALKTLPKLYDLSFHGNSDLVIEDDFYKMTNLKSLDLSKLKDFNQHKVFRYFSGLEVLIMNDYPFDNLEGIADLENLKVLEISRSAKLVKLTEGFPKLLKLEELTLPLNKELDVISNFVKLAKLPKLRELRINFAASHQRPVFSIPRFGFKSLKTVRVEGNRSDDLLHTVVDKLSHFKSIQNLHLSFFIDKTIPESLFTMVNLKSLYLSHLKVAEISGDLRGLEKLESFTIFSMPELDFPKDILKLKNLKKLNLTLSDKAIAEYNDKYARKMENVAVTLSGS